MDEMKKEALELQRAAQERIDEIERRFERLLDDYARAWDQAGAAGL